MRHTFKTFITIIFSALILTSCRQNNYKLFIIFDDVSGLTTESEITASGLKIGTVDKLEIFKNKILATTTIDHNVKIPRHSIFTIESVDLFGKKTIAVNLDSVKTQYYQDNDTIYGQVETNFFSDSISVKNLKPFVDTLANAIRQLGKTHKD